MATIKATSVPSKRLAASITGASTSFQLNNILGWDGAALTASDFGSVAYAVLRDDSNTVMEIIEFDPSTIASASITINRRGLKFTGDLTTEVSGNKLTWIKNETIVELGAAVPQLLTQLLSGIDAESITGVHTFDNAAIPRLDATGVYGAGTELYLATKEYVDSVVAAGAADGTTTAKGVFEEATEAEIEAGTAAGSTSARLAVNPSTLKSSDYGTKVYGRYGDYAVDAAGSDTYAITLTPAPAAYTTGMMIQLKPGTRNTGACTVNVNGLGAKDIKIGGADPTDTDLDTDRVYILMYDGTNFEVLNPKAQTPTGSMQMYGGATAPSGFLLCDGSAVSRTTYAALFAVIADTYGAGNGTTTFNVPDMRGRVAVGVGTGTGGGSSGTGAPTGGSALTAVARAGWKGAETHALVSGEMPAHSHTAGTGIDLSAGGVTGFVTNSNGTSNGVLPSTSSAGSGTAHNNIQPVMGVNFIIKI